MLMKMMSTETEYGELNCEVRTIKDVKIEVAPDAENIEGNTGSGISCEPLPVFYDSTLADLRQPWTVECLLKRGAENAITAKELVGMIGCKSVRTLQIMIANERKRGAPILSRSSGGYYLPSCGEKGRAEIEAFIHTLYSRAVNTLGTLSIAKRMLRVPPGQEGIHL